MDIQLKSDSYRFLRFFISSKKQTGKKNFDSKFHAVYCTFDIGTHTHTHIYIYIYIDDHTNNCSVNFSDSSKDLKYNIVLRKHFNVSFIVSPAHLRVLTF